MSFFFGSVVMAVLSVIVVKNAYKLHAGGVPTAEAHLVTSSHAISHYKIGWSHWIQCDRMLVLYIGFHHDPARRGERPPTQVYGALFGSARTEFRLL